MVRLQGRDPIAFVSCLSTAPGGMEQKSNCDGSCRLSAEDDDDAEGRKEVRMEGLQAALRSARALSKAWTTLTSNRR